MSMEPARDGLKDKDGRSNPARFLRKRIETLDRRVKKLEAEDPVLRFSAVEWQRVVNYSVNYGEGGFQARLRVLIAHWASQHFQELVKCMS